ncbi:MAG: polysaccharide pyruvyl transferase family protein [Dehalococcoidia bacterium]|nr:MAG: polysaccharide pyruvyl transferase family protein [Dehalococcoidia bacterium]
MSGNRFFIFGYYGWKNVGDDAMLYALLRELNTIDSEARYAVLSSITTVIPSEVKNRVKFVRLSYFAVGWEILRSSAFVLGGGTHLFDYGKKLMVLKIQLRIFILVLLSKLLRKKVYLLGNGLGPFPTAWGRFLSRLICHLADYISVRDEASYRFLASWGLKTKASLAFDLSALIENHEDSKTNLPQGNKKILGISILPVFQVYNGSREKDSLLIGEFAKSINALLGEIPLLEVCLFVFKGKSRDDDVEITKMLLDQLQPAKRVKLVQYDPDPRIMLAQVSSCTAFVGMRYHSCIFAYLLSIPMLIINYHPKCRDFAEDIGLPAHAVVSLGEVLDGQFQERLKNLIESPKDFNPTLAINQARQRAKEGVKGVKIR